MPFILAQQSVSIRAQPRIVYLRSAPTGPQVVANYSRGLTLFGRSRGRLAIFEWRSFPLRAIITPETANVPRSVRRFERRTDLEVRFDRDFEDIIQSCQTGRTDWVWLTPALINVYREVNALGFVSTAGVYRDGQLVAGIWGITVGRALGVMSMFHRENNSGALALSAIVDSISSEGRWSVVDMGVMKPHFKRYGAIEVPQDEFCELVWKTLR